MSHENNMLHAALALAGQGFAVFPCHYIADGICSCGHIPDGRGGCSCGRPAHQGTCDSPGKHPMTPNGFKPATTDAEQIRAWWTSEPLANIGIATGAPSGGIFVVDVDIKNDVDGREALAALQAEHGQFPATLTATTGSGGMHLFFRIPDGKRVPNNAKTKLGAGIDIRGDGGYVIAAPSLHRSGARYAWNGQPPGADGSTPIADSPEWLLERVRHRGPRGGQSTALASPGVPSTRPAWPASSRSDVPLDRRIYRARAWLRHRDPAIEGSNGSGAAMSAAHVVVIGFDLDVETAIGVMTEWSARCVPPWSEAELRKKVMDAAKNEPGSASGFMLAKERKNHHASHHASAQAYAAIHASSPALDVEAQERLAIQDEGCGRLDAAVDPTIDPARALLASEAEIPIATGAEQTSAPVTSSAPARIGAPPRRRLPIIHPADRIRRARGVRHLPSGYPTIDSATRGGFAVGKLAVWIGQPGAAKTGAVLTVAVHYARAGYAVSVLAADQEASEPATRIGQQLGFSREDIEACEPRTVDALQEEIDRELPNLVLHDATEDDATIEDVAEELAERAGALGVPGILIIDSLQTARLREVHHDSKRAETDAKIEALKHAKRALGLMVHVTSEMSRAGYGGYNPRDRVADIATAKESGSIEYAADVSLVLRPAENETGIVDVVMPKNRLGADKPDFRLRIDFARATVTETERPKDDSASKIVKEKVKNALRGKPDGFRNQGLLAGAIGVRKQDVGSALSELQKSGEVLKTKGGYHLAPDHPEPREPVPEPA